MRFFSRLLKSKPIKASRRRLRFESLEGRRLLALDLAVIQGTAFVDANNNGTLDAAETRINNATVQLFRDANANNNFDAAIDTLVATTTSNAQGAYQFASSSVAGGVLPVNTLTAGRYFVRQTTGQTGSNLPANVSIVDVSTNVEASNASTTDNQAGLARNNRNIDTYTDATQQILLNVGDTTGSNSQDAIQGGNATILGDERDIQVVRADGNGTVEVAVDTLNAPDRFIIDGGFATSVPLITVQYDGDDNDPINLDVDGLVNAGVGVDFSAATGFRIQASSDQAGASLTMRVHTSATSASEATLNIPQIPPANPQELFLPIASFVRVAAATTAANLASIGSIELVINAGNTDAQIAAFVLGAVQPSIALANLVNVPALTIGNTIFQDSNNNGTQNAGELGIASVPVNLIQDANANNIFDAGVDTAVANTTTNAQGVYTFANRAPGNYFVQIPQSAFNAGGALAGFIAGTVVTLPATDIDSDNNGAAVAGQGVVTGVIPLQTGSNNDGDGDANTNLTIDIGVVPQYDLGITKTATTANAAPGGTLTYNIVVTNSATSATASNVRVTDTLPTGLTTTVANITAPTGTVSVNGQTITVDYATVTAGELKNIQVVTQVSQTIANPILNNASVASTGPGVEFTGAGALANTDPENTPVVPRYELTVTKTNNQTSVVPGTTITYDIVVTNSANSPSTAQAITLSDVLSNDLSGITAAFVNAGVGTVQVNGQTVSATVTSLNPGQSQTLRVSALLAASATTSPLVNRVDITGATGLANSGDQPGDNFAVDTDPLAPSYNLILTKTALNAAGAIANQAVIGQQLVYQIVVRRDESAATGGPSTAQNVTITDVLPTGLNFVSATTSNGTAVPNPVNRNISVNVGAMAPGAAPITLTVTTTVANDAPNNLQNGANVTSSTPGERNGGDNAANVPLVVDRNVGVIRGFIGIDMNNNQVYDAGIDRVQQGITVTLTGPVTRTTTTNAVGQYEFLQLPAGTYTVTQTNAVNDLLTDSNSQNGDVVEFPAAVLADPNAISNIIIGVAANNVADPMNILDRLVASKRQLLGRNFVPRI